VEKYRGGRKKPKKKNMEIGGTFKGGKRNYFPYGEGGS